MVTKMGIDDLDLFFEQKTNGRCNAGEVFCAALS